MHGDGKQELDLRTNNVNKNQHNGSEGVVKIPRVSGSFKHGRGHNSKQGHKGPPVHKLWSAYGEEGSASAKERSELAQHRGAARTATNVSLWFGLHGMFAIFNVWSFSTGHLRGTALEDLHKCNYANYNSF